MMLVIESKAYVFSVGDCKGFLFRNEVLFQLNLDHLPVVLSLARLEEMKEIALKALGDLSSTTD